MPIFCNQDIDVSEFIESEERRIRALDSIYTQLTELFEMPMRDPTTGVIGKITRKRMNPSKSSWLEGEYEKLGENEIWNKREIKRIAKKLDFDESKVYKWCGERRKKRGLRNSDNRPPEFAEDFADLI